MLTLDTRNLSKISPAHGVREGELAAYQNQLAGYLAKIDARDQGFYQVIDDQVMVDEVKTYTESIKGRYAYLVVLAIGGSSLGTITLQQSLQHLYQRELTAQSTPKLYVLDNIDPTLLRETEDVIDYAKTLFVVVTKSGGTPETLAQFFYFKQHLSERGLTPQDHMVFVTDPKQGLLRQIAREEHFDAFSVPGNVGGRFSVLTAVGLLPAALLGLDVDSLIAGARLMRDSFFAESYAGNLPFQLATIQYALSQKGKSITVLMPYAQKLIRLADWYRQLLAESTGKQKNNAGETVNVGLTPVNALGATDQHSQSQLYNEGPNDKLIIFIAVGNLGPSLPIPSLYPDNETVNFLAGVDFNHLIATEKRGTEQALTEYDRPNLTIEIDKVDAESLGELFMLFEGATAFLGEFFEINAFDQPGVELSKVLTRQLLNE